MKILGFPLLRRNYSGYESVFLKISQGSLAGRRMRKKNWPQKLKRVTEQETIKVVAIETELIGC